MPAEQATRRTDHVHSLAFRISHGAGSGRVVRNPKVAHKTGLWDKTGLLNTMIQ
jgi:hypothetical protein